jgi:hypothetical protein
MKVDVEIELDDRQVAAILRAPLGDKTVRDYIVKRPDAAAGDVVRAIAREAFQRAELRAG